MFTLSNLKKTDIGLIIPLLLLSIIGGITVFSTTYYPDLVPSRAFFNQIMFYVFGFIIFFILASLNIQKLNNKYAAITIYTITLALLVGVLIFGEKVFDAKRWISIGQFTLQPSEFTKISIIIITSFLFTFKNKINFEKIFDIYSIKKRNYISNFKELFSSEVFIKFLTSFGVLLSFIILILLQKSLGNVILITLTYLMIIFLTIEINLKSVGYLSIALLAFNLSFGFINFQSVYLQFGIATPIDILLLLTTLFLILASLYLLKLNRFLVLAFTLTLGFSSILLNFTYNQVLEPYQRNRIETFLNPDPSVQLSDDYNRRQAEIALGSGRIIGNGFLNGNIVKLGLLPFAFTDFAFAAYGEQFGFIGVIVLLSIYLFLVLKLMNMGTKTKNTFGQLVTYGVASILFLNMAQHIGMNLGLLPITGVPLPLISYGGSAVLTIFVGMGLVQSIKIYNEEDEGEVTNFKEDLIINTKL